MLSTSEYVCPTLSHSWLSPEENVFRFSCWNWETALFSVLTQTLRPHWLWNHSNSHKNTHRTKPEFSLDDHSDIMDLINVLAPFVKCGSSFFLLSLTNNDLKWQNKQICSTFPKKKSSKSTSASSQAVKEKKKKLHPLIGAPTCEGFDAWALEQASRAVLVVPVVCIPAVVDAVAVLLLDLHVVVIRRYRRHLDLDATPPPPPPPPPPTPPSPSTCCLAAVSDGTLERSLSRTQTGSDWQAERLFLKTCRDQTKHRAKTLRYKWMSQQQLMICIIKH